MNGVNSEMVLDGFLQEADAAEMRSDYVCSQTPIPTGISQGKEIRPRSECPLRPQTAAHPFSAGSRQFEPIAVNPPWRDALDHCAVAASGSAHSRRSAWMTCRGTAFADRSFVRTKQNRGSKGGEADRRD
jgi:hypothetical protein